VTPNLGGALSDGAGGTLRGPPAQMFIHLFIVPGLLPADRPQEQLNAEGNGSRPAERGFPVPTENWTPSEGTAPGYG
jgi:hypothetical protein